jgi:hypothetical protein
VQLETELRTRAAVVSQQEIALEKWQTKAKALECKNRLLVEQQRKAEAERKGGAGAEGDPQRVAALEAQVVAAKEKARITREALQFTTEELEARCARDRQTERERECVRERAHGLTEIRLCHVCLSVRSVCLLCSLCLSVSGAPRLQLLTLSVFSPTFWPRKNVGERD